MVPSLLLPIRHCSLIPQSLANLIEHQHPLIRRNKSGHRCRPSLVTVDCAQSCGIFSLQLLISEDSLAVRNDYTFRAGINIQLRRLSTFFVLAMPPLHSAPPTVTLSNLADFATNESESLLYQERLVNAGLHFGGIAYGASIVVLFFLSLLTNPPLRRALNNILCLHVLPGENT